MKEYIREFPLFSLCGLNCGLCPRYHTDGPSKCTGCGGEDFYLIHPACAVITCNLRHDNVDFCYLCSLFPCERYNKANTQDSFITYKNVISDLGKAKDDLGKYRNELNEKITILEFLISNYNDGRRKSFYCIAANLLGLAELRDTVREIEDEIKDSEIPLKDKIEQVRLLLEDKAKKTGIKLKLRK